MVSPLLNQEDIKASKEKIADLVTKFESNKEIYLSKDYKEEDIKVEFITPMFKALGWDVDNESDNSPQFKDVIFEESISVGNKTKNPDYTFQIGGQKIFFLEAKAPHKHLDRDRSPAYQVRRYGWSAGLDICILTDFEEFAIYETNTKPDKNHHASIGRVKYFKYTDYVENWEEIYSILSKDAVMKGLFDKFVQGAGPVKKGTSRVDTEFLKEINHWREILARNIALRNEEISIDGLNYAVQLTIDRILFFRMAEDRGIERYKTLYRLADKENIYQKLMDVFRIADAKYNSGLFCLTADPTKHLNRDTVTEDLIIDDGVFKEIFKSLYYPESPYEFSVISPEILGIVYEQFLGSRIRLTDGHRAKIEPKPEIKKAGGVFYTPQVIVRDIVENTVGKIIKGKSIEEVDKIKIIDIACGSGSFILGAYKYLLDYYLDEYLKQGNTDKIYQGKDGKWRLSISEKKRILKNSIYGVDIDFLAVEVSKLTLLLQVLEDQNKDVVEQQQTLFHERVLPDLSDNVKNGNTIIETDYITIDTDAEELDRIKPFNYRDEFPEVFEQGGFDAIVTNPPYVRQELISSEEKEYFESHYDVYEKSADYYVYFYERAFDILKDEGFFGLICSNKFTKAKYGKKLRELILENTLNYYIDYEGVSIFKDAALVPSVMVMKKSPPNSNSKIFINKEFYLPQSNLDDDIWIIESPRQIELKDKILSIGTTLGDISSINIYRGITSGYNKAFVLKEDVKNDLIKKDEHNSDIIHPLLRGRDIKQWQIKDDHYIIFSPIGTEIKNYPYIKEHLNQYIKKLKARTDKGNHYWEFRACSYYDNMFSDKIVWAEISPEPAFCVDLEGHIILNSAYLLTSTNEDYSLYYLVGLLNSNITKWVFKMISPHILAERLRFTKQYVSKIPIVNANIDDKNKIIQLSKEIIKNYDMFNSSDSTPSQKKIFKTQIKVLEDELNQIIYQLYDLTEDEIAIIEELV